ncbi:MAG: beta-lactamase family protein [Gemmataceae bacterium]|nr:beta-lactamase family protein [Gemmataceae bacterium]
MQDVPIAPPEALKLDLSCLLRAEALLQRWVESDRIPAAAMCVGRDGCIARFRVFGRHRPDETAPLREDAQFLVASITKPVTATAIMLLVERGLVSLHDRVVEFVPAFAQNDKQDIRLIHLLTHTSGLPDMAPENIALRQQHRPLSAFVEAVCRLRPAFAAGTQVSYQSTGSAILAEVVRQVSGKTIADFLRDEVFTPLGMADTSLGVEPARQSRIAAVRLPRDQVGTNWHWNTPYWLSFGAPWGGLITSPLDLARFCLMMLGGGALGNTRILSPAAVRAMTTNQLATLPLVPEEDRRARPWGLGWRLNWPGSPSSFGDLLGPRTYGHWGATGTLCWIDPDAEAFLVLLTTQPLEADGRYLARVSNLVASAWR